MDRDRWGLSKSQRLRLKALVCILGLLLIAILLFGKLVLMLVHRGEEEKPKPHVPVIETLFNVWIMEAGQEGIMIFEDGESTNYPLGVIATTAEWRFANDSF